MNFVKTISDYLVRMIAFPVNPGTSTATSPMGSPALEAYKEPMNGQRLEAIRWSG
jgi:hypothetical protein